MSSVAHSFSPTLRSYRPQRPTPSSKIRVSKLVKVRSILVVDEARYIENSFEEAVGEGHGAGKRGVMSQPLGDWTGAAREMQGRAASMGTEGAQERHEYFGVLSVDSGQ